MDKLDKLDMISGHPKGVSPRDEIQYSIKVSCRKIIELSFTDRLFL